MFTDARGHSLEYRWLGENTTLAPLLFLHEGLGSIDLWRDYPADVVDRSGHRGLVYSRYGHGRSDPVAEPREPRFMHDEALAVLPGLVDDLVGEAPIMIGHSDGASIALIYAGAGYPVKALVLIAPHVMVEDRGLDQIENLAGSYNEELAHRMEKYHDNPAATFRAWADIWLAPEFRSWNIEDYLAAIDCPILMIQSVDDAYGTLEHLDLISAGVSGSVRRLEVNGESHSPHLSHSGLVTEETVRFISELDRTGTG